MSLALVDLLWVKSMPFWKNGEEFNIEALKGSCEGNTSTVHRRNPASTSQSPSLGTFHTRLRPRAGGRSRGRVALAPPPAV
ncbi:hypothetical protein EVAR_26587_1 [Eumeta japonica]|uniref:Uncharacterized protein n=1 Tax=Eumeta variegata TaxID=151549 RepID=A0A4C1W6H2_EUMVA|nr:hypothetical protein EVAR_26587_1 [Eumeta japonica]